MPNRRQLFAALVPPPAAENAVHDDGPKPQAPGPHPTPDAASRFAPPLSGRELVRRRYFPDVTLTTSDGRSVRFYEDLLKDRIVVLNLMYVHCKGICPTTTANLKRVRRILRDELAADVYFYSLTIKPEEDSLEDLQQYAARHEIDDPHWLFLSGKPDDVDLLRHKLGFADPDRAVDADKSRHSGMLRYGNEPLAVWGSCQSSADPEWIAQEIGFAVPRDLKRHPRSND